jgi:hypothetical protein
MPGAETQDSLGQGKLLKERKRKKPGVVLHFLLVQNLTKLTTSDKILQRSGSVKILARLMPFFPLSFIILLSALEIDIIEEDFDMNDIFDHEQENEKYLKVAIVEDKAYWVVNNTLYEADVVDEEILKEEARVVDAFDMDFKQVTKMMAILDNIQDWKN